MKISEKANDLIGEFSRAVERTALSPSESMFRLYCATRENLEDYIAELEAAQRWIPVSERLPEVKDGDEKEYDVVLTYPFRREVIVGTWGYNAGDESCKRRWFDISDDYGREDVTEFVTHWRERPTPPEESKK